MSLIAAWLRIPFWQRVLAGFVLGALAGWAFGPSAETWFGPLGTLYVTLIKMIAVPLVFFAVMNAVASLHGQKSMALLGGRTFLWFAVTAALAFGHTGAEGKVTGTISSQTGETAVTGVMAGSALKLDFNVETPQGQIAITMTGELSATGIAGKATIVGLGDADWTATRAK